MRKVYLLGAILGTIVPYWFFIRFLAEDGLDISLFVEQTFGTPIAAFFVFDVLISALVLWAFILSEGRRLGVKNLWVYFVSTLIVGVSLALPLFLYFRQGILDGQDI